MLGTLQVLFRISLFWHKFTKVKNCVERASLGVVLGENRLFPEKSETFPKKFLTVF